MSELGETRVSLLLRLKNADDQESWRQFFDSYWRFIYSVALRSGLSEADAEDVVQETILGIVRSMGTFEYRPESCSFKGWLVHITKRRIIDHHRKKARSQSLHARFTEEASTATEDPSLNVDWDAEWERNLFEAALDRLREKASPTHFQIFDLVAIKGVNSNEVARAFNVSTASVYLIKHRLARGLAKEANALRKASEAPVP
ncbi:MAG TPA: sigma-70 family RNA polymerase sigma factor [Methylomirabilota bacterium]|nr:sigma-70 family RNA polymerase sigma factor [Methylomirabilota bacterium]